MSNIKKKEYNKKYRELNKEKIKLYKKKYREKNKESMTEYFKKYYLEHPDYFKKYSKNYYNQNLRNNTELRKKYTEDFFKKNKDYYKTDVYREKNKIRIKKYYNTERGKQVIKDLNKKSYLKYTHKAKARAKLNYAIKKGYLNKPTFCSKCNKKNTRIEGHHTDYSKPFDVVWLCTVCHNNI